MFDDLILDCHLACEIQGELHAVVIILKSFVSVTVQLPGIKFFFILTSMRLSLCILLNYFYISRSMD